MKRSLLFLSFFIVLMSSVYSQYDLGWAKTMGGKRWDQANCVIETKDRGLVLAGNAKKAHDYVWIVKLDFTGREIWGRMYEDTYFAKANCIIETKDKKLLVVGKANTEDKVDADLWIMKMHANGKRIWEKTYGGRFEDEALSVVETDDLGYAIAGFSEDAENINPDFWVLKTDSAGEKIWDYPDGGDKDDRAIDIVETYDGNLIVVGYNMSRMQGHRLLWITKLDANGEWIWDEYFNKSYWDSPSAIIETTDRNLVISGFTKANGSMNYDVRVFKIDQSGNTIWDKSFGRFEWEEATDIVETYDQKLALSAFTMMREGYYDDFWTILLNQEGEKEWDETFGGSGYDYPKSIIETFDKALVIGGSTYSNEFSGWDFAILKLTRIGYNYNFLPQVKIKNPLTYESITQKPEYILSAEISSMDTLQEVKIFINDSAEITINEFDSYIVQDSMVSIYKTDINKTLNLQEGRSNITVSAKNPAGTNFSTIYSIFHLLLLEVRW